MARKIYVVLPAYNEELSIGKLIRRISLAMEDDNIANYEIIVVNDGSKDRTAEIVTDFARNLPITLINHEVNQGLGATIRDGLRAASEKGSEGEIVITMDADDTHAPGLIPRLKRNVHEGFDVVIASRYRSGARVMGLTLYRKVLSYGASWIFRILFPTKGVRDFTCGYRAYRVEVLQKAFARYGEKFVDQQGFQCMVDIILKLRKMDILFGEVPFILRYDQKEGASKMNVSLTIKKTFSLIGKRFFE